MDRKVANGGLVLPDQVGMVVLGHVGEHPMEMKQGLAIKPLYERGHYCKVCGRVTLHRYLGPQLDKNLEVALHLWNCTECRATISLDSPEEVARRCFQLATRRMRQRREARRYG